MTLADLGIGESGTVAALHVPPKRAQRLMDLGFIAGQCVTAVLRSPFGDPTAYQVLDTVIALRRSDAKKIDLA